MYAKKVQMSNKNILDKNRVGMPQKGQKRGVDLQRNAVTSLIQFVQLHKLCIALEINPLFLSKKFLLLPALK